MYRKQHNIPASCTLTGLNEKSVMVGPVSDATVSPIEPAVSCCRALSNVGGAMPARAGPEQSFG
jgi:hypothetical protein